MSKSKYFFILAVCFIAGIGARSLISFGGNFFLLTIIFAIIITIVFWRNKQAAFIALVALVFGIGVFRIELEMEKIIKIEKEKDISGKITIIREPEKKDFYQNIWAQFSDGTKFIFRLPLEQDVSYGDEFSGKCVLRQLENKNKNFNYQMYLAAKKVYYICENPFFTRTARGQGNKIYETILYFKEKMENNLRRFIPEPQAALAGGILLGGDDRMSQKMREYFSKTGMTHIVAVSGYNVTIIAEYLIALGILVGLWRQQAFWLAVIGIFLFVLMIGFPASAVRAGVMGTLLLWAIKNGRLANSWNAILFSASIMLFINPMLLGWDIGFQLSFLATIGIIALSPLWDKFFIKKHEALGISEIILLSLSAQIFVFPIIMYHFQKISLVSLIANALILPIVPLSMLAVFLTAVFGFIFVPLAVVFAWLANALLLYEIWVIKNLAEISWSQATMDNFSLWMMFMVYAILGIIIYSIKKRKFQHVL